MSVLVQKFGGSSVADIERIQRVARHVVAAHEAGHQVVVVVSAMGKTTDQFIAMAHQIDPSAPNREMDMLLSVGERISMALLSMAIHAMGHNAISFTGSQCGIITTASHSRARIIEVRPFRVMDELETGRIVIVAGFQGTSYKREITTLGRGGSDTTAIALAAALGATCEIYSDIEGVYTADPKVVLDAHQLAELSYEEMLSLSRHGARVLNAEAVEFARQAGIAVYTRSTFEPRKEGSVVRVNPPREVRPVLGVTGRKGTFALELAREDRGLAAVTEDVIVRHGLVPDFVTSGLSDEGTILFVFSDMQNTGLPGLLHQAAASLGDRARVRCGLGVVTAVGEVLGHESLARDVLRCLSACSALVGLVATPTAVSALVPESIVDETVRRVHAACFPTESARE